MKNGWSNHRDQDDPIGRSHHDNKTETHPLYIEIELYIEFYSITTNPHPDSFRLFFFFFYFFPPLKKYVKTLWSTCVQIKAVDNGGERMRKERKKDRGCNNKDGIPHEQESWARR